MAEAPKGGPPSKPEEAGHPEILDLPKYGALYGRFLLASQAQPGEVANILDPNQPTEFNLTTTTLKKRNYNPISENLSFKERQEEWREAPSFADAYREWKTKFTSFMTKITDPKREFILSMIMHDSKKATDFNETDADGLFNDFCKGKSDVTAFIDRVTASLVNPDSDGKIDPMTIQNVLPHIEWIASGLFGKKTASQVVTRLIELESALRNNPEQVLGIFNSDKLGRINMLADDEWEVLGNLHRLIPQAKDVAPKPVTPVVSEPTPTTVSAPKPDEEKPLTASVQPPEADLATELAKWKKRLAESRTIPNIVIAQVRIEKLEEQIAAAAQTQPPAAPIPPTAPAPKPEGFDQEQFDELLKQMFGSEKGEEVGEPEKAKLDIFPIPGKESEFSRQVILSINGEKSEIIWDQYRDPNDGNKWGENAFWFNRENNAGGVLKIPRGIGLYVNNAPNNVSAFITGGKGAEVSMNDLEEFVKGGLIRLGGNIILHVKYPKTVVRFGTEGKARSYDFGGLGDRGEKEFPIGEAMQRLKKYFGRLDDPTDLAPETLPHKTVVGKGENIVNVDHINIDNLPKELNKLLNENKDKPRITLSFSPRQLQAYMASAMAKGFDIKEGIVDVGDDGNEIKIKGLRITKKGVGITLDLVINNTGDSFDAGIYTEIAKFHRDVLARFIPDSSRGLVEGRTKHMGFFLKEKLREQIVTDNPAWSATNISIKDGAFLIRFEKTPQTV